MRKLFVLLLILGIGSVVSQASVYKGQRAFMKICKKCHKSGGKLAKEHSQDEWEEYFDNNAQLLLQAHKNDQKALEKLQSKRFKKSIRHMRQFFMKYANDSGNVPACN